MIRKCSYRPDKRVSLFFGQWGNWSAVDKAENGYFGCGLNAKSYDNKGDCWGIHVIQVVYCHKDDWKNQKYSNRLGANEIYGDWSYSMCPHGYYIIGGSVRNQPPVSRDNLAIFAISITCRHPKTKDVVQRTVVGGRYRWFSTDDYEWIPDVVSPSNYVCGVSAQIDPSSGSDGTGINGVIYKTCEMN